MGNFSITTFTAALLAALFIVCSVVGLWRLRIILSPSSTYRWETRQAMLGIVIMCCSLAMISVWALMRHTTVFQLQSDVTADHVLLIFRGSMCFGVLQIVRAWTYDRCGNRGWLTLAGIVLAAATIIDYYL